MDKIRFSKTDSRRTVMALAVVAMFVATLVVTNDVEASSPVSIDANGGDGDRTIMVGQEIDITLTLDSSDTRYRKMDVYMKQNWPGGTAWSSYFTDVNGDELANGIVTIQNGQEATVMLKIICDGVCSAGDENDLQVWGTTDPKFYQGSSRTNEGDNKCGSDDCETDTTPASAATGNNCLLYTSPSPRDGLLSRMPSSA